MKIQDAFLSGRRAEAFAAVPDSWWDEVSLVGSAQRIKDRLQAWKEAGKTNAVGSMLLSGLTSTRCASSPKRFSSTRARRGTPARHAFSIRAQIAYMSTPLMAMANRPAKVVGASLRALADSI